MKLQRKVCVIGVGMTKFYKPGEMDYTDAGARTPATRPFGTRR